MLEPRNARRSRERLDLQKSLVGFVVGDVFYAVPISHVREIINPIELTVLPHAPPSVAGVADHRGDVVTVIDLRRHLGLPPLGDDRSTRRRTKWILIRAGTAPVGLIVDHVTDVFGTGGQALKAPPPVGGADERGFLGVLSHQSRLTYVLDVTRFESAANSLPAGPLRGASE